jgi:hypothetical protein
MTMPAVSSLIQGVVTDIHHNHLYPVSQLTYERPVIDLIIGVCLRGRMRLMKTQLTAITKVVEYEAVGAGADLANFIIKRFYGGRLAVSQAVFIAAEALKHAKDFVPGCGGQTNIIVMYGNKLVGYLPPDNIAKREEFLARFDDAIAPTFFGGTDATVTDEEFSRRVDELARRLKRLRNIEAIAEQAAQVRSDVTVQLSGVQATVTGGWISPSIAAGDIASTPSLPPQPEPVSPPTRKSPTRGRKRQRPSPE